MHDAILDHSSTSIATGRSIRLFLVDGTPNGLLTAEIMNWTGHALTGPRTRLAELVKRPECGRSGVYFLVGPNPDNASRSLVYIGESDDISERLKQHNRPEEKGGKDFWEQVCLITSKDQNLTKAHIKFLESHLIALANQAGRCRLINSTSHEYSNLPEADRADMAFFIDQIRVILPVLGFSFLRDSAMRQPAQTSTSADPSTVEESPLFVCRLPSQNLCARGQEVDGEFVVLKDSQARGEWIADGHNYQTLYDQLRDTGVLIKTPQGHCLFNQDYAFSSPSAAAAIVTGRAANGRKEWKIDGSQQTYGDWQDNQVQHAVRGG